MYDGGFGGGGFDWNGNGHRDHVDGYMDYKVSNSGSYSNGKSSGNSSKHECKDVGLLIISVMVLILAITYAMG